MRTRYTPPVEYRVLEAEMRDILTIHASQLAAMREPSAATGFLGVDVDWENWKGGAVSFSLAPFRVWKFVGLAYDYAYQVGDPGGYLDENGMCLNFMLDGFARIDASGKIISPLTLEGSLVRQVADTALARYLLDIGAELDLNQAMYLLDCSRETATKLMLEAQIDMSDGLIHASDLFPILVDWDGFVPSWRPN